MTRNIVTDGWEWEILPYSHERGEHNDITESDFLEIIDEVDTFFLLVGFPKVATSTIATVLNSHTDICLPNTKEPFYFNSDEYHFGSGFYWEKYFQDKYMGESVIGEAATPNSFIPFTAKRIAETIPDAKVIFALRNPVDRAFSNWWMYYRSGLENIDFEQAIEWELAEQKADLMPIDAEDDEYWHWYRRRQLTDSRFLRRRTTRTYLMRGYYACHINRFQRYFDDDQLLTVFQDRLHEDRVNEMNQVFSFLGLPEVDRIESRDSHTAPKHPLHGFVTNRLLKYESIFPDALWEIGSNVLDLTEYFPGDVGIDEKLRMELFDYYRSKNAELESIINRDLPEWNDTSRY